MLRHWAAASMTGLVALSCMVACAGDGTLPRDCGRDPNCGAGDGAVFDARVDQGDEGAADGEASDAGDADTDAANGEASDAGDADTDAADGADADTADADTVDADAAPG